MVNHKKYWDKELREMVKKDPEIGKFLESKGPIYPPWDTKKYSMPKDKQNR